MILGDLLDSRVLDHQGGGLGYVVDVRLALELREDEAGSSEPEADAPLADRVRRREAVAGAEVIGLVVSPRTAASLLGYERTDVRSPWPIAALVRRWHRGTFLVSWSDVDAFGDGSLTLVDGFERRDPQLA